MGEASCRITVFFEDPFWAGVFERYERGRLTVSKVTFGAEPKEYEVWDFVLKHYYDLRFSPAVEDAVCEKRMNPKLMQREVKKQMSMTGIGTKSQQALKLQHEQFKTERRRKSHMEKEAQAERRFELKRQKRKKKHRGR